MNNITLTIDGKTCDGVQGDTILEVARRNDVYIPTLCFLEGLTPIGSCRMCVVEVEKNPKMLTACTTPAQDGMVVHTQTEKLREFRRQMLELIFAGRNHFCMYCSQSGDCELQDLAIEHGMDSVRYPYLYAGFDNDATHRDIQMDHNRCILCLRCIRVCAEKVGTHTLDLQKRGWNATIVSDLGRRLGESSTCTTCGACAQVCPTGTITLREFAYRGRRKDCDDVVESVCPLCSIGCRIKAYVRTGSIARVEGTSVTEPDGGQLCKKGRWTLPRSAERERISVPMIREGSHYREASWEEALDLVARNFQKAHGADSDGILVSSLCTDEELSLFVSLFKDGLGMERLDTFDGDVLRGFVKGFEPFRRQGVRPFTAAHNILDSDCIVNLSADPDEEAPVIASYMRVGTLRNGASLLNLSCKTSPFADITDVDAVTATPAQSVALVEGLAELVADLKASGSEAQEEGKISVGELAGKTGIPEETVERIINKLAGSQRPVFVLGGCLSRDPGAVTSAVNLAIASRAIFEDGIGVVPLVVSGNSLGTINTVLAKEPWIGRKKLDFLYVYSTGLVPEDEESLSAISGTKFVVVQCPFWAQPLVNFADVLLPAPAWFERSGHYCTIEGERRRLNVVVPPKGEIRGLASILKDLSAGLGVEPEKPKESPCGNLFASEKPPADARMVSLEEVRN
ncbi:MAG TPA: ferredoxin [Synergistaceae bacterium]|nr:MAG: NADH:ubiquinone oxidoreductase, subunit G, iron-sulfur binding protein [Synergistales bacterium 57_84]KUK88592.1 MAG: NADH:ubiquinone oxidoreductase, subunit G, iron-sulfur binding protein [Synergistales bacterium 58_81]HBG15120.1 ferredoxin [Synergistaceae bacterium]HCP08106.1 ferredoxin [Synergistaceae bacterium]